MAWDISKAYRETTPTRERICLNGLWRWQPAAAQSEQVPTGSWGYFKVPGCWPGITDYMQKDSQTVFAHPDWKDRKLGEHHRGLVSAGVHGSRRMGRTPHRAQRRVPELLRRGLCGREEGGRNAVSGGRGGPHFGLPAGREASC